MTSKIMIKSFLVNLCLTTLKLLGSFFSHSKTLMGDAVHCLSDMATDIMGLIGSKLSSKSPDKTHPFGYGKIEYLTSIMISLFILLLGLGILINSFNGNLTEINPYGILVIIISIIIKFSLSCYLLKKGKDLNSNILLTNGKESRYDSYCSCFALLFMLVTLLSKYNKIFLYADIIGGIITSILTIKIGIELLRENISSILGEVETDEEKIIEIENTIKKEEEISKVKNITLLKYGSYYSASIEASLNENLKLQDIYELECKIKNNLKESELDLRYITINFIPEIKHAFTK